MTIQNKQTRPTKPRWWIFSHSSCRAGARVVVPISNLRCTSCLRDARIWATKNQTIILINPIYYCFVCSLLSFSMGFPFKSYSVIVIQGSINWYSLDGGVPAAFTFLSDKPRITNEIARNAFPFFIAPWKMHCEVRAARVHIDDWLLGESSPIIIFFSDFKRVDRTYFDRFSVVHRGLFRWEIFWMDRLWLQCISSVLNWIRCSFCVCSSHLGLSVSRRRRTWLDTNSFLRDFFLSVSSSSSPKA